MTQEKPWYLVQGFFLEIVDRTLIGSTHDQGSDFPKSKYIQQM